MRFRVGVLLAVLYLCGACGSGDGDASAPPEASVTTLSLPEPVAGDGAKRVKLATLSSSQWGISGEPDNLLEAFGSVWTKTATGKVVRLDPDDGHVLKTIDTGFSDLPGCEGFGADRTGLWACAGENKLVRIDPDAGTVGKPVTVSKIGDQLRLAATDEGTWVIDAEGTALTAIDEGGRVKKTVALDAFCIELAAGEDALWVVCPSDNVVIEVDPAKGRVVRRLGLPEPRLAMVTADRLWVDVAPGLAQIDTSTAKVDAVYAASPGQEGGVWDAGDAVWVRAAGGDSFLTRIDPVRHTVQEVIEAPKLQSGGDVITVGDDVWATAYNDSTVVKLSPDR